MNTHALFVPTVRTSIEEQTMLGTRCFRCLVPSVPSVPTFKRKVLNRGRETRVRERGSNPEQVRTAQRHAGLCAALGMRETADA